MEVHNQGEVSPSMGPSPQKSGIGALFGRIVRWCRGQADSPSTLINETSQQTLFSKSQGVQNTQVEHRHSFSLSRDEDLLIRSTPYWSPRDGITSRENRVGILIDVEGEHVRSLGAGCNGLVKSLTVTNPHTSSPETVVIKHLQPRLFDTTQSDWEGWEDAQSYTADLFQEARISRQLNEHPNCGHILYAHAMKGHPGHVDYTIQEPIRGGSLQDRLNSGEMESIPLETRIQWAKQLTSAVAFMNSLGYAHRDLKCDNVLLTTRGPDAEVKLIDFGCAAKQGERVRYDGNGRAQPPELEVRHGMCTVPDNYDAWGLGWTLCELFAGKERVVQLQEAMKKNPVPNPQQLRELFPSGEQYDKITRILGGLFHPDPVQRLTSAQANAMLNEIIS